METRLRGMVRSMNDRISLDEYASMLRKAEEEEGRARDGEVKIPPSPPSGVESQYESSYILRLEAQLCRALHKMGVLENQRQVLWESCSEVVKSLHQDVEQIVEDQSKIEKDHKNHVTLFEKDKVEAEARVRWEILRHQERVNQLEMELKEANRTERSRRRSSKEEELRRDEPVSATHSFADKLSRSFRDSGLSESLHLEFEQKNGERIERYKQKFPSLEQTIAQRIGKHDAIVSFHPESLKVGPVS